MKEENKNIVEIDDALKESLKKWMIDYIDSYIVKKIKESCKNERADRKATGANKTLA